jgi:hypothetical protein
MDNTQDYSATGMEQFGDTNNAWAASMGTADLQPNQSFAANFRNRGTAMTTEELRKARENRAAEALRMKDEQLRILSEQNANFLKTLNKVNILQNFSFLG